MRQSELRRIIREELAALNEMSEPKLISNLRSIVADGQNAKVKCPSTGKMHRVDLFTASKITQLYDRLPASIKNKFGNEPLLTMVNMASKF